jgi:hypothetical protein
MNDCERMATAIRYLDRHHAEQTDLTDRLGNFRVLAVARGAQTSSRSGDQASSLILTFAGKMPACPTGITPVPRRPTLPNEAQGLS